MVKSYLGMAGLLWVMAFGVAAAAVDASAAPPAGERVHPALWVVKDADTTVYLFGTVHVLKPDIDWFNGAVREAFDASDEVVMELLQPDPKDAEAMVLRIESRSLRPDGPVLTERLPAAKREAYASALGQMGIRPDAFDRLAPWLAAATLSTGPLAKAGYDVSRGVEQVLTASAEAESMKLTALESADQQAAYLGSLSDKAQIQFLVGTLDEMSKLGDILDVVVAQWASGDAEALARSVNQSLQDSPELARTMLYQRNARWADWIVDRMKTPGVVFVAVGAGHLAGKGSLQDELARHHLQSRRIAD